MTTPFSIQVTDLRGEPVGPDRVWRSTLLPMSLRIVTLSPNTSVRLRRAELGAAHETPAFFGLARVQRPEEQRQEPGGRARFEDDRRGAGSTARGFREASALAAAVSLMASASIFVASFSPVVPAHPDPVPSGVRHVRIMLASA